MAQYKLAIQAIAFHNLADEIVDFKTNSLACLLRLCDELQEWDRRRINMEQILMGLYLDITDGQSETVQAHQMIDTFEANLKFELDQEGSLCANPILNIRIRGNKPDFVFSLSYRNPIDGHYDPAMTALCKAYRLQHLNLDVSSKGTNDLNFKIEMNFPVPREYGGLSEYDIYALFTENERNLPLLREFPSLTWAEPGLIHIKNSKNHQQTPQRTDAFGIVLTRTADREHHYGWLDVDPAHFFNQYIELKKSYWQAQGDSY